MANCCRIIFQTVQTIRIRGFPGRLTSRTRTEMDQSRIFSDFMKLNLEVEERDTNRFVIFHAIR